MATISVPFTSGVIADGAIQERHLANSAVSARTIDQKWPVIIRERSIGFMYVANSLTVVTIPLGQVCSRALVTFRGANAAYNASQYDCGLAFNFGSVSVGLERTTGGLLQPGVLITQDYRQARRLTDGTNETTPAGSGRGIFSAYEDSGLYGWYSVGGTTASFLSADVTAKGALRGAWLDGQNIKLEFFSHATSGGPWTVASITANIYAI
jgi:hypothetical protein